MSKHWQPPTGKIALPRFDGGKRLHSLDEFVPPDFVGRSKWARIQSYRQMERSLPEGAKVG